MKKSLLLIACVACLLLCACTPRGSEVPETIPAPIESKPTPGMTVIAPSETPVEIIDPVDPSDDPVIIPVETPAPTPEGTPAPTPADTPDSTPEPTPDVTTESTSSGIDLPWIPA